MAATSRPGPRGVKSQNVRQDAKTPPRLRAEGFFLGIANTQAHLPLRAKHVEGGDAVAHRTLASVVCEGRGG